MGEEEVIVPPTEEPVDTTEGETVEPTTDAPFDYTEQLDNILDFEEINQNQNEEIKGLLENIHNSLETSNNSNIQVNYTEQLTQLYDLNAKIYEGLFFGLSLTVSLIIIYFIYKIIIPFTR